MCDPTHTRRRAPRALRLMLLPMLLAAWCLLQPPAFAACLPSADTVIRQLQALVNQDAKAALSKVKTLLDGEAVAAHPNLQRLAALYDVQAQAYSILELEADARDSV